MTNIIIGNIISGGAAVFTGLSSWTKDTKKVYLYQVYQCILLSVASIFFNSYAGIATLALCGVRDFFAYKGTNTKKLTVIMIAALVFISIFVNNRGAVGWIVTSATILYTIGVYIFRSEVMIKINILVDLALWIVYEIMIFDFVSLVMDSIVLVITVIAIGGALKRAKQGKTRETALPNETSAV